jgi:hypothetical protein
MSSAESGGERLDKAAVVDSRPSQRLVTEAYQTQITSFSRTALSDDQLNSFFDQPLSDPYKAALNPSASWMANDRPTEKAPEVPKSNAGASAGDQLSEASEKVTPYGNTRDLPYNNTMTNLVEAVNDGVAGAGLGPGDPLYGFDHGPNQIKNADGQLRDAVQMVNQLENDSNFNYADLPARNQLTDAYNLVKYAEQDLNYNDTTSPMSADIRSQLTQLDNGLKQLGVPDNLNDTSNLAQNDVPAATANPNYKGPLSVEQQAADYIQNKSQYAFDMASLGQGGRFGLDSGPNRIQKADQALQGVLASVNQLADNPNFNYSELPPRNQLNETLNQAEMAYRNLTLNSNGSPMAPEIQTDLQKLISGLSKLTGQSAS